MKTNDVFFQDVMPADKSDQPQTKRTVSICERVQKNLQKKTITPRFVVYHLRSCEECRKFRASLDS